MEENDYLEQIALEEQRFQDLEEQARQDALLEEILAQQKTYQEESQTDQNSKKSNSKSSRPTDNQMQNRAKGRVSEQRHQRKATEKVFGQSMQQNAKTRISDDSQREKATKYARQTREENQPKNLNQQEGENSMPINKKDEQSLGDISPDDFYEVMLNVDGPAMNQVLDDYNKYVSSEEKEKIEKNEEPVIEIETIDEVRPERELSNPDKQNQGQGNSNTNSSTLEENEVIKSENFLRNNMKDGTYINRDKVDDINQQFWNEKESLMSKGFLEPDALKKATEHKEEALKKLCKDAEKYSPKKLRQMQMTSGREGTKKEFYHCVKDKDGRTQLKQTTIGSKQTTYKQMRKQRAAQEKSHAHKSSADMLKRGMPEKAMGMIGDAQSQSMTTFKISASLLLLIIKAINATLQNAKYNHIEKKIRDAIEIGEMDDDFFDITANDIQQVESEQNGIAMSSKGDEGLEVIEPANEELESEKTDEEQGLDKSDVKETEQEKQEPEPKGLTEAHNQANPKPEPKEEKTLTGELSKKNPFAVDFNRESAMEKVNEEEGKSINPDDIDKDGVNDEFEEKQAIVKIPGVPTDNSKDDDGFEY